ncbi:MAG: PadR family transcriptional regulator [Microbacterium ginsengisoli]|nr:PadR family transcriptional regulator [Microbacterium ginsengisoli]
MMSDHVDRLSPMGVMVLALLREGPMHPYEMMRLLRERREDRLLTLANGTLYHAVAKLAAAELIVETGVDRDGNRPERTTYALTPEGDETVAAWVRRELPRIDRPASFRIALAEAHNLDRTETVALLRERRAALEAEADDIARMRCDADARGSEPQYLVEIVRQQALLTADLAWIDRLLDDLVTQAYPWGVHASA